MHDAINEKMENNIMLIEQAILLKNEYSDNSEQENELLYIISA
jgi:hypothetical protein